MKKKIHPKTFYIYAKCSCGNKFNFKSTLNYNIDIDICSLCHPFYTKKDRNIKNIGKIGKFNKNFDKFFK